MHFDNANGIQSIWVGEAVMGHEGCYIKLAAENAFLTCVAGAWKPGGAQKKVNDVLSCSVTSAICYRPATMLCERCGRIAFGMLLRICTRATSRQPA